MTPEPNAAVAIPTPPSQSARAPSPGEAITGDVTALTGVASKLGYEIVDISGFLDALRDRSDAQLMALERAQSTSQQVSSASEAVSDMVGEVVAASSTALETATRSIDTLQVSADRSSGVASWVSTAAQQIETAVGALGEMEANNDLVREIASQISYLSINARIEATRAGEDGRQFSVIANAVNELSARTNEVANDVRSNIARLTEAISHLAEQSTQVRGDAEQVIADNAATHGALGQIAEQIGVVHERAGAIQEQTTGASVALNEFRPAILEVGNSIEDTSTRIAGATKRAHSLVDMSETIVQECVSLGGETPDSAYIAQVTTDAQRMSEALEAAVASSKISMQGLFSRDYQPISGTAPTQVMAPFTKLTDELFSPIQEEALKLSQKVVFCAAVNIDGYLPTHNLKFSKPQGNDVEWNTGNCRNRRIFDDRVGLKSGKNTKPFLVQVYRRDMGNGVFKLMKDVSAPIWVNGKHWGGLRLAYTA